MSKLLCALVLIVGIAEAQVNTATLLGTVKDATGGSVPNAKVTVTNIETSQERTVSTDSEGNYTVPNLPVGHYTVTVTASGFKTATVKDIELQVAQMASANAQSDQ